MGESKQKSRNRAAILARSSRCIFCLSEPTTIEHMPPICMFPSRDRPSGMEYPACQTCNEGSRAADAAAAFFARLSPTTVTPPLELQEAHKYFRTLMSLAPGFSDEFLREEKSIIVMSKGKDPIFTPKRQLILDGPIVNGLLRAFSVKVGMALFFEHTGNPLPADGVVYTKHYLNSGLTRNEVKALLPVLPGGGQLKQGKKLSGIYFNYRFNTDEREMLAALVAFNDNFFVRIFALSDPRIAQSLSAIHESPPLGLGSLPFLAESWNPTMSD
jgi:hypothetical protein